MIITAVCNFPNINDTLEKNVEYYLLDLIRKDNEFLRLYSFYNLRNGCEFIPVELADSCPKLNKLQELNPIGKGWFWCIGYVSEFKDQSVPFYQLFSWLKHYLDNYHSNGSSITAFLFEQCIISYIYEHIPEGVNVRRLFDVVMNKKHIWTGKYDMSKEDYIKVIEDMPLMNWYELIFKYFN